MNNHKFHIRVIASAAALACAPFLATPAAQAATSGWQPGQTGISSDSWSAVDTGACTVTSSTTPTTSDQLVPNVRRSFSTNAAVVAASNTDATNTVTQKSTMTGSAELFQSGSNPTGMKLRFSGSQTRQLSKATAPCEASMEVTAQAGGVFTLTRPTVATTETVTHGPGHWQLQLQPETSTIFSFIGALMSWVSTPDSRTHRSFYLTPGTYMLVTAASMKMDNGVNANTTARGRMNISFGVPGARTGQTKPSRYVKMPKSQSCVKNTISAKVTKKHKLAKRIKKIRFYGPKLKNKKIRHHIHKGRTIKVHTRKNAPVDVNVRVRLRNGRVINSSASYLQCS